MNQSPKDNNLVIGDLVMAGALTGGLIGAGTGALIGSVIHNGSIVKSALLGGGIGIAAGAAFSGGKSNVATNKTINNQQYQIEQNNSQLRAQQRAIEEVRREMDEQNRSIILDTSRRSKVYDGATIGSYMR